MSRQDNKQTYLSNDKSKNRMANREGKGQNKVHSSQSRQNSSSGAVKHGKQSKSKVNNLGTSKPSSSAVPVPNPVVTPPSQPQSTQPTTQDSLATNGAHDKQAVSKRTYAEAANQSTIHAPTPTAPTVPKLPGVSAQGLSPAVSLPRVQSAPPNLDEQIKAGITSTGHLPFKSNVVSPQPQTSQRQSYKEPPQSQPQPPPSQSQPQPQPQQQPQQPQQQQQSQPPPSQPQPTSVQISIKSPSQIPSQSESTHSATSPSFSPHIRFGDQNSASPSLVNTSFVSLPTDFTASSTFTRPQSGSTSIQTPSPVPSTSVSIPPTFSTEAPTITSSTPLTSQVSLPTPTATAATPSTAAPRPKPNATLPPLAKGPIMPTPGTFPVSPSQNTPPTSIHTPPYPNLSPTMSPPATDVRPPSVPSTHFRTPNIHATAFTPTQQQLPTYMPPYIYPVGNLPPNVSMPLSTNPLFTSGATNYPSRPPAQSLQPRKKEILRVVDPKTGEEVNLLDEPSNKKTNTSESTSSSSTTATTTTTPSESTNTSVASNTATQKSSATNTTPSSVSVSAPSASSTSSTVSSSSSASLSSFTQEKRSETALQPTVLQPPITPPKSIQTTSTPSPSSSISTTADETAVSTKTSTPTSTATPMNSTMAPLEQKQTSTEKAASHPALNVTLFSPSSSTTTTTTTTTTGITHESTNKEVVTNEKIIQSESSKETSVVAIETEQREKPPTMSLSDVTTSRDKHSTALASVPISTSVSKDTTSTLSSRTTSTSSQATVPSTMITTQQTATSPTSSVVTEKTEVSTTTISTTAATTSTQQITSESLPSPATASNSLITSPLSSVSTSQIISPATTEIAQVTTTTTTTTPSESTNTSVASNTATQKSSATNTTPSSAGSLVTQTLPTVQNSPNAVAPQSSTVTTTTPTAQIQTQTPTQLSESSPPPKKQKHTTKEALKKAKAGNYAAATQDAMDISDSGTLSSKEQQKDSSVLTTATKTTVQTPKQNPPQNDTNRSIEDEDTWENKDEEEIAKKVKEETEKKAKEATSAASNDNRIFQSQLDASNSSGKKIYSREFLLQFQPICKQKPANLNYISDVIFEKGSNVKPTPELGRERERNRSRREPSSTQPPYAHSSYGSRGVVPSGRSPRFRGVASNNRGRKMGVQAQGESERREIRRSENRWRRPGKDVDTKEYIRRKVQGILNRLTVEKFAELSEQILSLSIDRTEEILQMVVGLIFDKAVIEHNFSLMYADLCRKISDYLQAKAKETEQQQTESKEPNISKESASEQQRKLFRSLLLNKCQQEFEEIFHSKPPVIDPSLRPEEKVELELKLAKMKQRKLGTVKFIGELFKKRMLSEKIIHQSCLIPLLGDYKNPNEENLEHFCMLMSTIGQLLDHEKGKDQMNGYFLRLSELAKNKTLQPRIRFKIESVIELRKNNWQQRQALATIQSAPKTIKEVHEEAEKQSREQLIKEREQERSQRKYAKVPLAIQTRHGVVPSHAATTSRESGVSGELSSSGEWIEVHQRRSGGIGRGQLVRYQPKFSPRNVSAETSTTTSATASVSTATTHTSTPTSPTSSTVSVSSPSVQPPQVAQGASQQSQQAQRLESPQQPPQKQTEVYKPRRRPTALASMPPPDDEEEDIEEEEKIDEKLKSSGDTSQLDKQLELILEEYLANTDCADTIDSLKNELKLDPTHYPQVIEQAILMVLERKDADVELMADLFGECLESNFFSLKDFAQGFLLVLRALPDLSIDIPNAPKFFGKLVARAVQDRVLDKAWLSEHLPKLKPNEENAFTDVALKLLSELFLSLLENCDVSWTQQFIREVNINIRDYMPKGRDSDEQVDEWIKSVGLDRLFFSSTSAKKLDEIILKGSEPDTIRTWIKEHIPFASRQQIAFIQALVGSILKYIQTQLHLSQKSDLSSENPLVLKFDQLLEKYLPIFSEFLEVDEEQSLQLSCLVHIQQFAYQNKMPKGFLTHIFNGLHKANLISKDMFSLWMEEDKSPGKQEAVSELKDWLNALPDDEEEPQIDATNEDLSNEGDDDDDGDGDGDIDDNYNESSPNNPNDNDNE